MLSYYLTQLTQLLANPAAPSPLYATADLTTWINTARAQVAGETGCIRLIGSLPVTSVSQVYPFSAITTTVTSVQNVYAVRQITRSSGSGAIYMGSRGYPWAVSYWMNNPAPVAAAPTEYAQLGQAATGSLVLNATPDQAYTLNIDATWQPIPLVSDLTAEAIPYPFQDAVPFYGAYLAYMSAQRQADAQGKYAQYKEMIDRARGISVPDVLPSQSAMYKPQQGGG